MAGKLPEKFLRDMTQEEIQALTQNAQLSQGWAKTHEEFEADNYEPYYFIDLGTELRNFLRKLMDYHEAPKRQIRRSQGVISELIMNTERHMARPFFVDFKISYLKDRSIYLEVVNSTLPKNFSKARDLLDRVISAQLAGQKAVDEISDELMNKPGKGGMGLWNITTQFYCNLWVTFDDSTNRISTLCIVGEK